MNREQRRKQERAERRSGSASRRIAALGSGAVLAVSAGGAALTLASSSAGAAVNDTVTTLDDSGTGSLRAAIEDANANGGGTISFAPGLTGTIPLASDLPDITESVTITGPGAASVTVDANGFRAFYVDEVVTLTISGLTLTDGAWAPLQVFDGGTINADAMVVTGNDTDNNRGGGLNCNEGNLTLTNSTVTGNIGGGGGGGLYLQDCDARIVSTTIADNQALDGLDGGGLYIEGGTTSIENSTISGNYANDNSAAVYIDDGGESGSAAVTISNSTIANNTAANSDDPGVGISVAGGSTLDLIQSTVTGNHHVGAPQERDLGALYLQGGSYTPDAAGNSAHVQGKHGKPDSEVHAAEAGEVNIIGTIITGNGDTSVPGNFDIFSDEEDPGTVNSDHSIIGVTSESVTVVDQGGTQRNVDPLLGPLANNGGPTQTMALLAGSPAIDHGPVPVPSFPLNDNDQRGAGFPRVVNGTVDVGAYEVQAPAEPAPAPEVIVTPRFTG
jgi:hypothetical protein